MSELLAPGSVTYEFGRGAATKTHPQIRKNSCDLCRTYDLGEIRSWSRARVESRGRGNMDNAAHQIGTWRSHVQEVRKNSGRYRPRGVRVGNVEYVFCHKDSVPFRRVHGGGFASP